MKSLLYLITPLTAVLISCGSPHHSHQLSSQPTAHLQISHLPLSSSDASLRYGIFAPSELQKQATDSIIVFLLGKGEWIEQYLPLYQKLYAKLQRPILTLDHLGQGGSGGERGHIGSYHEYVSSTTELLETLYPHGPSYTIIAHSTGGLIALYGTLKGSFSPQSMILTSPLIQMRSKPVPRFIAHPISYITSLTGLSKMRTGVGSEGHFNFAENRLTTDPKKYKILQENPFPIPSPTMGWINATFQAQRFINNPTHIKKLPSPLLIFQAEHEHVVDPEGISQWIEKARSFHGDQVQDIEVTGGKHALLYEKEEITSMIVEKTVNFIQAAKK